MKRRVLPMRLDENFELVLVAGIQSFEITGNDLAGWSGWEFRGRSRQGQAQRKSGNKEQENAAHVQVRDHGNRSGNYHLTRSYVKG